MEDPELSAIRARELDRLRSMRQQAAQQPDAPVAAGVVEATDASVNDLIAKQRLVAVDAYATWCAPCKVFAPVFADAARKHPGVAFVKVDVDRNPRFTQQYRVQSMPTLLLFAEGRLAGRVSGALRPAQLEQVLGQLESLT